MKFAIDKTDEYIVLSILEPKINSLHAPDLKSELIILSNEGFRNIIIDLSQVNFVDSSGLSALLVGKRMCENASGIFVLANVSGNVLKLINISQLDKILVLIPTVDEARDYVMLYELERSLTSANKDSAEEEDDEEDF